MGKIELDHTGSGGGVTLSSDGTDLLLDGTAIGGGGGGAETVESKPDAYTVTTADLGKIIVFTGSFNEYGTLGTATDLGAGFYVTIVNQSGKRHTINRTGSTDIFFPNGSGGQTQLILATGASITLISDGTSKWLSKSQSYYLYAEGNNNSGNFKPVANGTGAVALGRGANAGGSPSFAAGTNSSFSGSTTNAAGSTALGGSYASGTNSFAAAIANNTSSYGATGSNSVAIGKQNKATGVIGTAVGGQNCVASNNYAFASGNGCIASGYASTSIGRDTTASDFYTVSTGGFALANLYGKKAHASGRFSAQGDAQAGTLILRSDTTDATAEALTTNNSTAGTTNQVILPNNSAYAFHGTIVARQQASAGTACAAWKIEGLIRREGSAGTTVLVNSATTVLDNTPAWGMALSADTTNGGLKIEVTGAAATNIRWVATISTSEVSY